VTGERLEFINPEAMKIRKLIGPSDEIAKAIGGKGHSHRSRRSGGRENESKRSLAKGTVSCWDGETPTRDAARIGDIEV